MHFNEHILVLGAGTAQVPLIKKCKSLNLYTIVVDKDIEAPGLRFADERILISTKNTNEILQHIKNKKIDGIVTTSDYPVRTQAILCEKLALKGPDVRSAEITTDKHLFRDFQREKGFLYPQYFKITDVNHLNDLKEELRFPLIVKPTDSSASRGVRKVNNLSELSEAYLEALRFSSNREIIVEEYIAGSEYSVEVLINNHKLNIVAITKKLTSGSTSNFFVEDRHIIPADISTSERAAIDQTVHDTLKSLGLNNCAAHVELKMTKEGPIVIEIGPRLGGDYIASDLVPLATGVDMNDSIIRIALDKTIEFGPNIGRFSGIQFINSNNYHEVCDHLDKIKVSENLVEYSVEPFKEVELKNSLNRLGYYICYGNNRTELNNFLDFK